MKNVFFGFGSRAKSTSLGLLILRVSIGLGMAIGHGFPHLMKMEKAMKGWYVPSFLKSFVSNEVSFFCTIGAELLCGILLAIGLMTRPAALIFAFTMAVAAFEVHGKDPIFMGPGVDTSKEPALLYMFSALALFATGAGRFSVDALIKKGGGE